MMQEEDDHVTAMLVAKYKVVFMEEKNRHQMMAEEWRREALMVVKRYRDSCKKADEIEKTIEEHEGAMLRGAHARVYNTLQAAYTATGEGRLYPHEGARQPEDAGHSLTAPSLRSLPPEQEHRHASICYVTTGHKFRRAGSHRLTLRYCKWF